MLLRVSLALLLPLAACGGSSSTPADATQADSGPPSVKTVTCPPGVVPTVTSVDSGDSGIYMPASTTISVGGIVKFMMLPDHNVAPSTSRPTDPGLNVGFGATACLEFDKAGTFTFMCASHGFTGTIVVQ